MLERLVSSECEYVRPALQPCYLLPAHHSAPPLLLILAWVPYQGLLLKWTLCSLSLGESVLVPGT